MAGEAPQLDWEDEVSGAEEQAKCHEPDEEGSVLGGGSQIGHGSILPGWLPFHLPGDLVAAIPGDFFLAEGLLISPHL
ncbi:hypothetical protein KB1_21470 [Cutibacterium modestum]|uniref:Uncharacterized protein n=1 Tax=Cutibacterium modestum TaxID=2559073 RepID=A0AAD1KQX9_9ACTN|nr:hypothetical protein KB1_21470 [Cutibacterium modestum]